MYDHNRILSLPHVHFFFHVHQTNLCIKLLFYVLYVNFKLYSLIILSPSLGFIVKIFDPGPLKMVSRVAASNDKKTQARDSGNKQKTRIKVKTFDNIHSRRALSY